jgi:hypothetical protein
MSRKLRPTDSIYRIAADLFALVLPETDTLNAKRVAVRLQEELQEVRAKHGKMFKRVNGKDHPPAIELHLSKTFHLFQLQAGRLLGPPQLASLFLAQNNSPPRVFEWKSPGELSERLLQIFDQIFLIFQSQRNANRARADPRTPKFPAAMLQCEL